VRESTVVARRRATGGAHKYKNHVWRNESEMIRAYIFLNIRLRTMARRPNPPAFKVAPVRSPGASPPGRLRPSGGAPLAHTLVPERW